MQSVKEQRVDGSLDSINLVSIRCTLVAGKPVFGRKIPFQSDNRRVVMGLGEIAFIHSTRPIQKTLTKNDNDLSNESTWSNKLDPGFIPGFIDAEGCFMLGFFPSSN